MYRRVFGDHDTIPRFLTAQAERLGDKPLLRFPHDGIDISYRALVASSEHGSSRLRGEHGIEAGMVAAILLPNGSAFIHAWFACLFGGIVDIPINHEFRKTALLFGLATAETRVVFTGKDGFAALVEILFDDCLVRQISRFGFVGADRIFRFCRRVIDVKTFIAVNPAVVFRFFRFF